MFQYKNKLLKSGIIISLALFGYVNTAYSESNENFPLDSLDKTEAVMVIAKPVDYKGRNGLHVVVAPEHKSIKEGGCDNCTFLGVNTKPFKNGTIEIEVAGKPQKNAPVESRGFVGVVFRINEDKSKYETIYLRPMNSRENDQLRRNHTVQYVSYPNHPWYQLRKEFPGKYETYADIETGEWIKLRIEVEGEKARLYINNNTQPTLIVNDLKHGANASGTIGLFVGPASDAYFRNLRITHR